MRVPDEITAACRRVSVPGVARRERFLAALERLVRGLAIWLIAGAVSNILAGLPALAAARDVPYRRPFTAPPERTADYTLGQAVSTALRNFPSIKAARFKLTAAQADVTLAKTAYLPNLDLMMQEMVGSNNVIAGTILPQTIDVIPIQSGQERRGSSFSGRLMSNHGANFNWLLFDFGLRRANVQLARAQTRVEQADLRLTELDVAFAAADAYLTTVEAEQTIRAAQATLDRMKAAAMVVHTLVDTGLRPGVDAARADYEVSQAKIGLIQAERTTELARVELAERMGIAGTYVGIVADPLVRHPPNRRFSATDFDAHPLAILRASIVRREAAKVNSIDREWYPHIWLNSAVWGRGSGFGGGGNKTLGGILPQAGNFAVGLTASFPVLDIFEIKARRRRALCLERAEKANFDLAIQILEQKDARARVLLTEAKRIADETPVLVKAAQENQIKTLERYKVGLTNIVAVAEAERLLARAEVENAIAQVEVWRAILAMGYVQGDLRPFLSLVAAAEGRTD